MRYTVNFEVDLTEWGTVELDANSVEEAEAKAANYIDDLYSNQDGYNGFEILEAYLLHG